MAKSIVILEQCEVAPSPGGAAEKVVPLLDFDINFLRLPLIQTLLFYDLHCSKSDFLDTIVPKLKNSLSLLLKHYSPLAGKNILPLYSSSATPFSHYVPGDSASFTIAHSHADFVHLTGYHSRDADVLCRLVPQLPNLTQSPDSIKFPVAAFQVTHFPDQGVCIGVTLHHSIADASTLLCLLRAWSSITKLDTDAHLSRDKCMPSYDRSTIKGADRLCREIWNRMEKSAAMVTMAPAPRPTNNVLATLTLTDNEIRHLKQFARPSGGVSTSVIVCAYLWTCFARLSSSVADDEAQYLGFPGDCRGRLDPPLPSTYFGNCVAFMMAESSQGRLTRGGKEGIGEAVRAIEEVMRETFGGENGVVIDDYGYGKFRRLNSKRVFIIAGSPNYDMDGVDFGWGRPTKIETMQIDRKQSVSLIRRSIGSQRVEIGLSMSRVEMDAFAAVFQQGITEAAQHNTLFLSKM